MDELFFDAYAFLHSRGVDPLPLSGNGAAVLHHAMFRLLSCRDVLEEIGDSSKERVSLPFAPALRNTILVSTVFECFQRWNRPELLDWLVGIIPRFIEVGEVQLGSVTNSKPNKDNYSSCQVQKGWRMPRNSWDRSIIENDISRFSYVRFSELPGT